MLFRGLFIASNLNIYLETLTSKSNMVRCDRPSVSGVVRAKREDRDFRNQLLKRGASGRDHFAIPFLARTTRARRGAILLHDTGCLSRISDPCSGLFSIENPGSGSTNQ
jgi:hypothetical protein